MCKLLHITSAQNGWFLQVQYSPVAFTMINWCRRGKKKSEDGLEQGLFIRAHPHKHANEVPSQRKPLSKNFFAFDNLTRSPILNLNFISVGFTSSLLK